jgi:hypothetical protein
LRTWGPCAFAQRNEVRSESSLSADMAKRDIDNVGFGRKNEENMLIASKKRLYKQIPPEHQCLPLKQPRGARRMNLMATAKTRFVQSTNQCCRERRLYMYNERQTVDLGLSYRAGECWRCRFSWEHISVPMPMPMQPRRPKGAQPSHEGR